jgi:hypothetical protein
VSKSRPEDIFQGVCINTIPIPPRIIPVNIFAVNLPEFPLYNHIFSYNRAKAINMAIF